MHRLLHDGIVDAGRRGESRSFVWSFSFRLTGVHGSVMKEVAASAPWAIATAGERPAPRNESAWPDEWLIAAVRREPPDEPALDALVGRYWKALFARCQLLTLDRERATDLAQETWCRVLRARQTLKPDGNFSAYLMTIAANLWRDWNRSARRAGSMAENRMASLDAPLTTDDGDTLVLADVVPDLNALEREEQAVLKTEIDDALSHLSPQLRDVMTSRFLMGESSAEIGLRYGRTEQTITAWLRQATREMKVHLSQSRRITARIEGR
jgi:RNA polymerase sigma-70 factor, ECF subfamily